MYPLSRLPTTPHKRRNCRMKALCPRSSLAALAAFGALACVVWLSPTQGQDKETPRSPVGRARPIPSVDFHVPCMGMKIFGMHAESNKPVLGKPTAQVSDLRYFYLPLLAFQKKANG